MSVSRAQSYLDGQGKTRHEVTVRAPLGIVTRPANENFDMPRPQALAGISQERTSSAFSQITTDCSLVGSVRTAAVFQAALTAVGCEKTRGRLAMRLPHRKCCIERVEQDLENRALSQRQRDTRRYAAAQQNSKFR